MSINPLSANVTDLLLDIDSSSLMSPATKGSTTISVYSISGFAINQVLLVGELGDEDAEIVITSATTSPSGNTVTLASGLVKDHPSDVNVYILLFNKIEFSHATTVGGTKTVLSLKDINPESQNTMVVDTTKTSGFFFTRYYNSVNGQFSDYGDPVPFDGFDPNTVGAIIQAAMLELDVSFSERLTMDIMVGWINQMLRIVRGKLKKWNSYEEMGYLVGTTTQGTTVYTLPTTIYNRNSNASVLNLYLDGKTPILPLDHSEYIQALSDNLSQGEPKYFSIFKGTLNILPAPSAEFAGKNIYMDFQTDITEVTSDGDYIYGPRFDMAVQYLKWKIKGFTEGNGTEDMKDPSYLQYKEILTDAVKNDQLNEIQAFRPRKYAPWGGRKGNVRR